jgi:hypothetical protein
MFALVLLGPTGSALAGGQAVLADAQDNGRVDGCYSRTEFRDALRMARNDQRLYSAVIDTIEEARITNVAVDGAPCGSGRVAPGSATDVDAGGGAGIWIGALALVGLVGVGAAGVAHFGDKGR